MRLIDADRLMEWIQDLSWKGRILTVPDLRFICNELAKDNNVPGNGWISVKDRMPENADHKGALCPRYLVRTKYGVSEGWYNHDKGCWYTLVWFLIGRFDEDDIDMERGDIPRVSKTIEVTHWMPLPEPPEV